MNMLNPTAIKDPSNYGPEDIEGLFIRRFKKAVAENRVKVNVTGNVHFGTASARPPAGWQNEPRRVIDVTPGSADASPGVSERRREPTSDDPEER